MIRKAFVMSVKPGCEEEYEKRHNPIWPELKAILIKHGVDSYSIFLHPDKKQLFAYAEIQDEDQWNAIADTEICQKWWRWMSEIMDTHIDIQPKAMDCREVFHIEKA
ncbi:MAG: L-rhamnose mutarotase [Verrucomicrobia bacterium]|jgi:L-rhamnose mutarotase|nr:L-rhamnose mutarotase [Verrucomicrobiota bacterium]